MRERFASLSKYTSHSTTIIFFCGFFFDMFILPEIDDPSARLLGLVYLSAVATLIIFREWLISRNRASEFERKIYTGSTFGIAYFSGSSLSFVFIYALRSAAISISWPLFLILAICIYANEFVSTHNFRLTLDVGVLLTAFTFYTIFHFPVLLKIQNDKTFALSIIFVIFVSLIYIFILKFASESAKYEAPRGYALAFGVPMFVGMLYFLNVLPAVPLSLKDSGVYHNIVRTENGEFVAQSETDDRMFKYFRPPVYHLRQSDTGIYFFSSVDAPAELSAPISHLWEYYDNKQGKWIESTMISFDLAGGREDGYRAYSKKNNISEGLWRVTVKVGGNRIIGRSKFWVEEGNEAVKEIKL